MRTLLWTNAHLQQRLHVHAMSGGRPGVLDPRPTTPRGPIAGSSRRFSILRPNLGGALRWLRCQSCTCTHSNLLQLSGTCHVLAAGQEGRLASLLGLLQRRLHRVSAQNIGVTVYIRVYKVCSGSEHTCSGMLTARS